MTTEEDLEDLNEPETLPEEIVHWQPNHRGPVNYAHGAVAQGALAQGASATGVAFMLGLAVGAMAIGALAIGALAIGSLSVGNARFRRLEVDELVLGRLRVKRR